MMNFKEKYKKRGSNVQKCKKNRKKTGKISKTPFTNIRHYATIRTDDKQKAQTTRELLVI